MDAKEFFAHVVRDLGERLESPEDEYQIIRASGLLRLLLLDQRPLLTLAHPRSRIRFEVNPPAFGIVHTGGDPNTDRSGMFVGYHIGRQVGQASRSLTLPDFLAFPAAASSWTGPISVRNVIKCGAVAFGGVHFERPLDLDDQVVEDVLRNTDDQEVDTLCRLLVQIGEVVVRAASPLLP